MILNNKQKTGHSDISYLNEEWEWE